MNFETIKAGDYYIPAITLAQQDDRPIGKYGRMHRSYLKAHRPILYNQLVLSERLYPMLADLNEQAHERLECIIQQMQKAEGVTEQLKQRAPLEWLRAMNSIHDRAEEIVLNELVYC